jgi:predicted transposase YbfD/YdcC
MSRKKAKAKQKITLQEHFAELPDPRVDRTKAHSLIDILVITICAAICGAEGWTDVEEFGRTKEAWLRQHLELKNGIPSHDTFGRVFEKLDPEAFERCFITWVKSLGQLEGLEMIAIDGKTLRRSYDKRHKKAALHLVSAWASKSRLVLGQTATAEKSNEITAIPELLDLLDLKGSLVTIDAMGCQTDIAQKIVDKGGDYLLAVKNNQKHLAQDIKEHFDLEFAQAIPFEDITHDYTQTIEKNRGRIETRECWTISEPEFIAHIRNHQAWAQLKTIALVRSKRQTPDGVSIQDRYYISSLDGSARTILTASRQHWGIENSLHWVLDVVFREDAARMRRGNMAHNFALIRHIALNLLRHEKSKKSIRAKRLKAALDEDYLLQVLLSLN